MVSQIRRSCGLYSAKVAKATDTPSGSSTWGAVAQGALTDRRGSIPTVAGANPGPEDAAASKGLDSDLNSSAGGRQRERGNRSIPATPCRWRLTSLQVIGVDRGRGAGVVAGVTPRRGDGNTAHRAKGASSTATPTEERVAVDTAHILKSQEELAQQMLANPVRRHKRLYRLVCDAGW